LQRPNIMQKLCLKSSEFESNIRDAFRELREEQDFFNVTLVCDEGEQIEAHKIVLSAGSHFFRDILRKAKHASPFIYLKGINRFDLKYLLDFLYNGEIDIGQEELNSFLETAKALKVKGLESNETKFNENEVEEHNEIIPSSYNLLDSDHFEKIDAVQSSVVQSIEELPETFDLGPAPLVEMKQDSQFLNANTGDSLDVDQVSLVEMEEDTNFSNAITVTNTNLNVDQIIEKNELDLNADQIIEKNELGWLCKICGKTAETPQSKWNLKKHVEKHIKGVSYLCSICGNTLTTSESHRKHIAKFHSDLAFNCDVCQKSGMTLVALNKHKQRKHSS